MTAETLTVRPHNAAHDPSGKTCAHFRYRMTCEDLDRLRVNTNDRCALCGTPGDETPHGSLHIDHDAVVGDWAVRGLLCSRCNTQLDSHVDEQRVAEYLADPWYLRMLAERGLSAELPPEPGVGTTVHLPRGTVMRRTTSGWVWDAGPRGIIRWSTWAAFHYKFGPHNLRLGVAATPAPETDCDIRQIIDDYESDLEVAVRRRNQRLRAAIDSGRKQVDLVRITGMSREAMRQALNPEIREAVRAARAAKRTPADG